MLQNEEAGSSNGCALEVHDAASPLRDAVGCAPGAARRNSNAVLPAEMLHLRRSSFEATFGDQRCDWYNLQFAAPPVRTCWTAPAPAAAGFVARASRHATAAELKRLEQSIGNNRHAAGVLRYWMRSWRHFSSAA